MELWIRSQDKKGLLKIDNVGINDYNGYYYVVSVVHNKEVKLGEYGFHTSTRALEVLDEIEAILMYEQLEKITGNAFIKVNNGVAIYEMPEE